MTKDTLATKASPYTQYYLPEPVNFPVGQVLSGAQPSLFSPFTIKTTTFTNRFGVSPMCTYSAASHGELMGHATRFHQIHYGAMAMRSPGLIVIEATAVSPEGRLSPECLGIWSDEHAESLRPIIDFAHSQGVKIGIQLNHGGRKSSGLALPVNLAKSADAAHYGWPTVAPSAISYDSEHLTTPRALELDEIKDIIAKFQIAAKRAYAIGVDFVEVHAAHGYLLSEFMSGLSNTRTDQYGGSFENRVRLLLEVVDAVKDQEHPLFVRISASDLTDLENAWTLEQSQELSVLLQQHGVDLLDISNGGNYHKAQRRPKGQASQAYLAKAVRSYLDAQPTPRTMLISSVGGFDTGLIAQEKLDDGSADVIFVGRALLKNPGAAIKFADDLGAVLSSGRSYEWTYNPPHYG